MIVHSSRFVPLDGPAPVSNGSLSLTASRPAPAWSPWAQWSELHRRALAVEGEDAAWLESFSRRVKCGDCRRHWTAWLAANPPIWSDYFGWTVAAHNAVNARLGRPVFDIPTARVRWSSDPALSPP